MKKSSARLCLQCCSSKNLIKREKNWYRLNNLEQAWKEALCGGCILTSTHRGHSSTRLLTLYFTSEIHIKLEENLILLQNLAEDKREEIEMKMEEVKQECKSCSTIAEGLKLIEEIDLLFEKKTNTTNDETFCGSLEIL
ncbi:unnamed protein product [Auanema sp. JU1783]|nr:unnamed protein product [Auanema sp. JU1783]